MSSWHSAIRAHPVIAAQSPDAAVEKQVSPASLSNAGNPWDDSSKNGELPVMLLKWRQIFRETLPNRLLIPE